MLELLLQAAFIVQQEVIVVSLDLQEEALQSAGYAGYIESIHYRGSVGISSRFYKNPGRPTHGLNLLLGVYHGDPE